MVGEEEHTDFEQNQSDRYDKGYDNYYGSSGNNYRGRGGRGGFGRGRGGRGGGGGGGGDRNDRFDNSKTIHLSDYVKDDNKSRALKMRGLPYQVTVRDIRDFFADFRVSNSDIIIDMSNGRPTGYALVFFESDTEAGRAKETLNKKFLGNSNRYVDLSFPDVKQ